MRKTDKFISEKFKYFPGQVYYDFNQPTFVPSHYIRFSNRFGKLFVEGMEDGLNGQILKYIDKSESFSFLADPKEDIYTFNDGTDIC